MPPRKKAVAASDVVGAVVAAAPAVKRSMNLETAALLSWLAVPDNRHIITGAAGVLPYLIKIVYFIALQVLHKTMVGWRQARLLFPKSVDLRCLQSIFRTLLAMHSTKNKHTTSFRTLSASFTLPKPGSERLVSESLMRTEHVVCCALLFWI